MSVILAAILLLLATLMSQGINTYLFADYFKDTKALALFSLLNLPSGIIVAVVSGKISTRYGKKESAAIGCFCRDHLSDHLLFTHEKPCGVHHTFFLCNVRNELFQYADLGTDHRCDR